MKEAIKALQKKLYDAVDPLFSDDASVSSDKVKEVTDKVISDFVEKNFDVKVEFKEPVNFKINVAYKPEKKNMIDRKTIQDDNNFSELQKEVFASLVRHTAGFMHEATGVALKEFSEEQYYMVLLSFAVNVAVGSISTYLDTAVKEEHQLEHLDDMLGNIKEMVALKLAQMNAENK